MDFSSLYPVMMVGGNLFSPANIKNGEPYWQGSGIYASKYQNTHEGIVGKYSKTQGKIEKVIYDLMIEKNKAKDNPSKRLATKILINTMYGIMGSPKFKSVHNITSAADVTSMARRSILHTRTVLEDYGYELIYSDTDSVYINVKDNNLDRLQLVIKYIVSEQKKSMNIPCDLHDFKLEYIIKRMYFFRNDKNEFIKKHYIFVTDKDEIVVKGLSVIKGNCSQIAKIFFEDVIKQQILKNKYKPYNVEQLLKELKTFSLNKEKLLLKRYRVKSVGSYKIPEGKEESTSLSYFISKKYGAGEHWLVANKRIGIGKGVKYATMEELQTKYGKRWIDQVSFEKYLQDLSPFIKVEQRNSISKIDRKRIKNED